MIFAATPSMALAYHCAMAPASNALLTARCQGVVVTLCYSVHASLRVSRRRHSNHGSLNFWFGWGGLVDTVGRHVAANIALLSTVHHSEQAVREECTK